MIPDRSIWTDENTRSWLRWGTASNREESSFLRMLDGARRQVKRAAPGPVEKKVQGKNSFPLVPAQGTGV